MGVQLWMVLLGSAMLFHAGYGLMAEKRAAALANEELAEISSQVMLEVLLGAAISLWGGIGEFKPIRISDNRKVRWESLHARPDFHCYSNRAKLIRPLLTSTLPSPPSK
uniref:Membrane magnesium transporter n=1 Tax=Alexandrium andersonii TaxID=327968 RepID=A0A7S2DF55_9DINO|mmetsp:Transcript_51657/g.116856  ORF Transcript_51657/g.116856 Transcript_51657/m.116856 type:complete len:109 (+) Transcript_51657:121-447(+)